MKRRKILTAVFASELRGLLDVLGRYAEADSDGAEDCDIYINVSELPVLISACRRLRRGLARAAPPRKTNEN